MSFLLDTQIVVWLGVASRQVPERIRSLLSNPDDELFVSSVSVWEIAAKHQLGKLSLPLPPAAFVQQILSDFGALSLPFTQSHALQIRELPSIHRDPFDRMLVCQARVEGLTLVTSDDAIRRYDVRTLW